MVYASDSYSSVLDDYSYQYRFYDDPVTGNSPSTFIVCTLALHSYDALPEMAHNGYMRYSCVKLQL